jgi:hypothetical protein
MTDVLIRYFSVARKPRSLKYCAECAEPCYPGLPRYRAQYFRDAREQDGFLHLTCATKWLTVLIRENRDALKKEART